MVTISTRVVDPCDPYFILSDAELEAQIRSLTLSVTSGEQQIASPDAGSVGYINLAAAERLLEKMKRTWFRRHGVVLPAPRIRYRQVFVSKDYDA